MKRKQVHNIIEKRYARINTIFDSVMEGFLEEDIHEFRVEVKKLRAFLRLTGGNSSDGYGPKLPRKLHAFYTVIGRVRSLQLQQDRIRALAIEKDISLPDTYLDQIADKIKHGIARAKKRSKGKNPFEKGAQKLLSRLPDKLNRAMIRRFTRSELEALALLLKPFFFPEDSLHSIRKILKDILYTWYYIEGKAADLLPSILLGNEEIIGKITDSLGDFQDISTQLALLQTAQADPCLLVIEKEWRKERRSIQENLNKVLQKGILAQQASLYPWP